MDTQAAIDFLHAYIPADDIEAREALSVLVVKISDAADALADVNDIAQEFIVALEKGFGPKPEALSATEWIASLASNTDLAPVVLSNEPGFSAREHPTGRGQETSNTERES